MHSIRWRRYSTAHGIIVNIVLTGYALHGCDPVWSIVPYTIRVVCDKRAWPRDIWPLTERLRTGQLYMHCEKIIAYPVGRKNNRMMHVF